jgi:hypothetical protein
MTSNKLGEGNRIILVRSGGQMYLLPALGVFQGGQWGLFSQIGLGRLRDLSYEGGIDTLLCLSPNRLARQYGHQCLLLEKF